MLIMQSGGQFEHAPKVGAEKWVVHARRLRSTFSYPYYHKHVKRENGRDVLDEQQVLLPHSIPAGGIHFLPLIDRPAVMRSARVAGVRGEGL